MAVSPKEVKTLTEEEEQQIRDTEQVIDIFLKVEARGGKDEMPFKAGLDKLSPRSIERLVSMYRAAGWRVQSFKARRGCKQSGAEGPYLVFSEPSLDQRDNYTTYRD